MPLTTLVLGGCGGITDLTPLEGMRLTQFDPPIPMPNKGAEVIRRMKTVTSINGLPAEEFWKKYDAGEYNKK
jgi:hypothetical protein